LAPSSAPGRGMGAAGGVAGFRRMDARTESGYVSENAESPPPLFAFPPQGPPGSPWVAVRVGCLLLGTRRSALPSFIFWFQGPGLRCVFYTAGADLANSTPPRASRNGNWTFFERGAPQFPPKFSTQNFPDIRFRGFRGVPRFGLGEVGKLVLDVLDLEGGEGL